MASSNDLLARGESISLSPTGSSRRSNKTSSAWTSSKRSNASLPSVLFPASARNSAVPRHRLLYTDQVGDLSKTLIFSSDAISSLGSNICTYASAKQSTRKLFTHENMQGFSEGASKRVSITTGRCNTRGSGDKHLPCHLMQPHPPPDVGMPGDRASVPRSSFLAARKRLPRQYVSDGEELTSPTPKDYVQQLNAGAKPLHIPGKASTIVLDNNTMFKKVLRASYPQPPTEYFLSNDNKEKYTPAKTPYHIQCQGHKRWVDVPHPIQPSADMPWECLSIGSSSTHLSASQELEKQASATHTIPNQPERSEFFNILKEWCEQWKLHIRLNEVGEDSSLVQQMNSVADHTRMHAVVAVSVLAENQALSAYKISSASQLMLAALDPQTPPVSCREVTPVLVQELERLLDDCTLHVRVPSALTLYCLDRHSDKAQQVLHSSLSDHEGSHGPEHWAAVQCLVFAGCVSPAIISELLLHLLDPYSPTERSRATRLLVMASHKTTLVQCMVADHLNNSGWQERLAACTVLPLLHHPINRDVHMKLLQLAWEDWSPEVQHAAAKALGRASHGKVIHDDIIERLNDTSVLVRLDAIRKLHSLQLMTSKLLPSYLACFGDQHLSMRLEAVALAGSLRLRHPLVMRALKLQLQDYCWMLKTSSLQALAEIGPGECDSELVELLMWAVRFEKVPTVREEACRTIARLGLKEERVIEALKELVTVDDEETVVSQAKDTLKELGETGVVRDRMMEGVCENVKRLGTKDAITRDLMIAESDRIRAYGMKRPTHQLTIRDYLDDRQRYIAYGTGDGNAR